jgi:hypothetical protein
VLKAIIGYAFPVPRNGDDSSTTPLGMGTTARSPQYPIITK